VKGEVNLRPLKVLVQFTKNAGQTSERFCTVRQMTEPQDSKDLSFNQLRSSGQS